MLQKFKGLKTKKRKFDCKEWKQKQQQKVSAVLLPVFWFVGFFSNLFNNIWMCIYIYMNMLSGKIALAATAVSQLKACLNLLIMQQVPDPKICCNSRLTKRVWLVCTALSPSSGEWNNYLATFCNCSALTVIFLNPIDILILVAMQSFFLFF